MRANPKLLICSAALFCTVTASAQIKQTKLDTTFINYPKELKVQYNRQHPYHQTLTMKLMMCESGFNKPFKRRDNGEVKLHMTCEQALEAVKQMDNMSVGIPKIVYLVGWQYNGHDSKYPAFFEGNPLIKRTQDKDANQSLRWLIEEAKKYNTTISFHINMFDAYEDSPLWEKYVANDVIARNADGSLRAGEWGYPISYAQEWKLGFAQERIDKFCEIFPMQQIGSVHIDAYHTWPPIPVKKEDGTYTTNLERGVTSPYLPFTIEDETQAQLNIIKYWNAKGVDVTSEGAAFLRDSPFEGYQTMAWWFGGLDYYLRWPAAIYCAGRDNGQWGRLFGTSMHGEDIYMTKDNKPVDYDKFKQDFCINTAVWYFLNRLERKYILQGDGYQGVQFSENVKTELTSNGFTLKQGRNTLVDGDDIFIPALWLNNKAIVAFSKNGYESKSWSVPQGYPKNGRVTIKSINQSGVIKTHKGQISNGKITLKLMANEMVLVEF